MYKYEGPPELAQEYDMPSYTELKAELYALSDSELEALYEMYKAYGPPGPPPKDELAQEPTYSDLKAEIYALSDSELEALYEMYKAYGPPELALAQEYEMPSYTEL